MRERYSIDGKVYVYPVGGISGGECYLVVAGEESMLVDCGFSVSASKMIDNITEVLGEKELTYCFLTHSHYDHASGVSKLRERYVDMKVIATAYATKVLGKESVMKIFNEMNLAAATEKQMSDRHQNLGPITVDITVKSADIIRLGGIEFEIIQSPGHTKCCCSMYSKELDFYIASESVGVYAQDKTCLPAYLVGYEITMSSISKLKEISPKYILISHYGVISGEEAKEFMFKSETAATTLKDLIVKEHLNGADYAEIFKKYEAVLYTEAHRECQPRAAFELNASYLIPMIISECCN